MKFKSVFLLAVFVVITRLPFLFTGYGADGDAWRVAHVGHTLWTSGVYAISRPPGYPAHEILSAPLVALGGSVLSNAVTLIASIIAIFVWHEIVRGRTQRPWMLTVAFAFAPLFWVNSAATMDYVWSLLMILLAIRAIMRTTSTSGGVWAGVWAGLAIGFRPTNSVLVAPLAILLLTVMRGRALSRYSERSPNDTEPVDGQSGNDEVRQGLVPLLGFLVSFCITVVVVFLPVVLYLRHWWLARRAARPIRLKCIGPQRRPVVLCLSCPLRNRTSGFPRVCSG